MQQEADPMKATGTMLVVGADGMIGRVLADHLAADGWNVARTTRKPVPGALALDLAQGAAQWTPPTAKVAFLCAAITSQEKCRAEPATSRAVNVTGTLALAEKLVRQGTHVVFPSTNLVLDGLRRRQSTRDPYAPQTEYARQKTEVEQRLRQLPGTCVVRFTKVLSRGTRLLRGWCEALQQGRAIQPFADMPMAPVPLGLAVEALAAVAAARAEGVVQVSATEDVSYAAAARFVARRLGAAVELVQPLAVADSRIAIEYVPRHTTLDTSRLRTEFGLASPSPWDAIELGMRA
jgi:dTDP-4-dehydrorhamnose reductase